FKRTSIVCRYLARSRSAAWKSGALVESRRGPLGQRDDRRQRNRDRHDADADEHCDTWLHPEDDHDTPSPPQSSDDQITTLASLCRRVAYSARLPTTPLRQGAVRPRDRPGLPRATAA